MTDIDRRHRSAFAPPDAAQWAEVERAFTAALDVPAEARSLYVTECSTDPAVRAAVARLLERHASIEAQHDDFLSPISRERAAQLVTDAESPPAQIGRYSVQRVLGHGAFGTVYLAHDPELGRDVAIKRLSGHLGDDGPWTERFAAEARAASRLAHPHIVTVHDVGRTEDGRLFIVMGYEGGGTLRGRLAQSPIPVQEAVRYAAQVADGLAAAHAAGLVHRDIKPENLLDTPRGVRIADFGIAKAAATTTSNSIAVTGAMVIGTAAYMSPEQSLGRDVDARADIWSLGVVLFELLTGVRPFSGHSIEETLHAVRTVDPPAPSTIRQHIPQSVDAIVARCLQRDPVDRFPSAESLRDELQHAARNLSGTSDSDRKGANDIVTTPSTMFAFASIAIVALAWLTFRPRDTTTTADVAALTSPSVLAILPLRADDTTRVGRELALQISSDLRSQLTAVPGLGVSPLTQTGVERRAGGTPEMIGARLGATAVLAGSVNREDSIVTIEASLIRSDRGDTLWRTRLRRPYGELATAEEEIVKSVAAALGATARPWRPPDPMAYELYLRGKGVFDRWNDSTIDRARLYFREAIAKDSSFALAWLSLAQTYTALQTTPPAERFRLAKPLVAKALAAEPNLAAAHYTAGWIASWYDHDWDGAERYFLRAIALDPNDIFHYHAYAALLSATGRPDSSLAITRRAMPLDPDAAVTTTHYAIHLAARGRNDEAIALLESLLARDSSWRRAFVVLGRTYLAVGRYDDALSMLERDAPQYAGLEARGVHAYALAATGRTAEARRMVAQMETEARARSIGAANLAIAYAALGDTARALDWLERMPDDRGYMIFPLTEPSYDPLRGSTRWRRVIDRLGLTAADTLRRAPSP